MKHNKKKISKIIDELITYFLHIGSKHIQIDVLDEEHQYKIVFNCNIHDVDNKCMDKLVKGLNFDKQEEMEEYYWELAGECDTDTELSIVGMMINQYDLNIKDDELELIIYRNKTAK